MKNTLNRIQPLIFHTTSAPFSFVVLTSLTVSDFILSLSRFFLLFFFNLLLFLLRIRSRSLQLLLPPNSNSLLSLSTFIYLFFNHKKLITMQRCVELNIIFHRFTNLTSLDRCTEIVITAK